MSQRVLQFIRVLTLGLLLPIRSYAQEATSSAGAVAELRATIRQYDDALRRGDAAAVEKFWARDYTFVNPRGERLTRAERGQYRAWLSGSGETAVGNSSPVN